MQKECHVCVDIYIPVHAPLTLITCVVMTHTHTHTKEDSKGITHAGKDSREFWFGEKKIKRGDMHSDPINDPFPGWRC